MVGDNYAANTGAIFKLNGAGQWKDVTPAPNFPNPSAVFGTASTDVWVTAPGVIWHWNGATWARSYSASHSDGGVETFGEGVARSPTDVWVLGRGFVLHFDGSSWSRQPMDLSHHFTQPKHTLWGNSDDLRLIGEGMLQYRP